MFYVRVVMELGRKLHVIIEIATQHHGAAIAVTLQGFQTSIKSRLLKVFNDECEKE